MQSMIHASWPQHQRVCTHLKPECLAFSRLIIHITAFHFPKPMNFSPKNIAHRIPVVKFLRKDPFKISFRPHTVVQRPFKPLFSNSCTIVAQWADGGWAELMHSTERSLLKGFHRPCTIIMCREASIIHTWTWYMVPRELVHLNIRNWVATEKYEVYVCRG